MYKNQFSQNSDDGVGYKGCQRSATFFGGGGTVRR